MNYTGKGSFINYEMGINSGEQNILDSPQTEGNFGHVLKLVEKFCKGGFFTLSIFWIHSNPLVSSVYMVLWYFQSFCQKRMGWKILFWKSNDTHDNLWRTTRQKHHWLYISLWLVERVTSNSAVKLVTHATYDEQKSIMDFH